MSARVEFEGLEALIADLRRLPDELKGEGLEIVIDAANGAAGEIRQAYGRARVTGNLADHVRVGIQAFGQHGAAAVVESGARHAHLYEYGTQTRRTSSGANRGVMPPGNVFVPVVIRRRRSMYERLKGLLRQKGLEVSGDAE